MEEAQKVKISKGIIIPLIMSFASIVLVAAGGFVYTGYALDQSNRKWCVMINPLYDTFTTTPPATEIGRKLTQAFVQLHDEFGC